MKIRLIIKCTVLVLYIIFRICFYGYAIFYCKVFAYLDYTCVVKALSIDIVSLCCLCLALFWWKFITGNNQLLPFSAQISATGVIDSSIVLIDVVIFILAFFGWAAANALILNCNQGGNSGYDETRIFSCSIPSSKSLLPLLK